MTLKCSNLSCGGGETMRVMVGGCGGDEKQSGVWGSRGASWNIWNLYISFYFLPYCLSNLWFLLGPTYRYQGLWTHALFRGPLILLEAFPWQHKMLQGPRQPQLTVLYVPQEPSPGPSGTRPWRSVARRSVHSGQVQKPCFTLPWREKCTANQHPSHHPLAPPEQVSGSSWLLRT